MIKHIILSPSISPDLSEMTETLPFSAWIKDDLAEDTTQANQTYHKIMTRLIDRGSS